MKKYYLVFFVVVVSSFLCFAFSVELIFEKNKQLAMATQVIPEMPVTQNTDKKASGEFGFFMETEAHETTNVVHRIFVRHYKSRTIKNVRLRNGHILAGEYFENVIGSECDQISDFYFVEEGDTIVYEGKKVIEVKFKD